MTLRHKIVLVFIASTMVPFIIVGSLVYIDFRQVALAAGLSSVELGYQLLFFMALLLLFVLLIGSMLSQLVVRPLIGLSEATAKIRQGDLSARAAATSQDEIGKLAADFNAMAKGLQDLEQAKTELTTMISHRLSTPVSASEGFMANLLDYHSKGLSAEQKKLVALAHGENRKVQSLIDSVLDVMQFDTSDFKLNKTAVNLTDAAEKAIMALSGLLKTHQQKVKPHYPEKPVLVLANAEKIQILIENLLSNASKYSPDKTEIDLDIQKTAVSGVIKVKDQGFGIDKKNYDKLFKMFSRLDNPKKDQSGGSGLGLYLVKKIVDSFSGQITLDSRLGHGATFTISLPLAK